MQTPIRAALLAAVVALGGCAGESDVFGDPQEGYVDNMAARAAAADWSAAAVVTVVLTEYEFSPAALRFGKGRPYRLRIENAGTTTHFFVSEPFFKAIAARRLSGPSGEVDLPYIKTIAVAPGQAKELSFVPLREGVYALSCTAPLHASFGMVGEIRID